MYQYIQLFEKSLEKSKLYNLIKKEEKQRNWKYLWSKSISLYDLPSSSIIFCRVAETGITAESIAFAPSVST